MTRTLTTALLTVSLLIPTACGTSGVKSPAPRNGPHALDTGIVWFWLGHAVKDADECPAGLAEVITTFPWYSPFVSVPTFGLVIPVKRKYYCTS